MNDSLHVCHVTNGKYPEAGKSTIYEYPQAMANLGIRTSIIAQEYDAMKRRNIAPNISFIKTGVISKRGLWGNIEFARAASKLLDDIVCDVVHIYSDLRLAAPILPLLSKKRKDRIWIRDIRSAPISQGISNNIRTKVLGMQSIFFDDNWAQSEGTRDLLFSTHRENIFIARQGVNLDLFQRSKSQLIRQKMGFSSEQTVLIFTGSLSPYRKLDILVETMANVVKGQGSSVVLLIVGDGDDRSRLEQLVYAKNLQNHIKFIGFVDYESIALYLSAADIGLAYVPNTSSLGEQPPLKTVEMLACELPVIASNTRGNRHFIVHEKNGLLVENTPKITARAIIDLATNPELRQRLSRSARGSIAQYHYSEIVQNSIIPQYYRLLERHNILKK